MREGLLKFRVTVVTLPGGLPDIAPLIGVIGDGKPFACTRESFLASISSKSSSRASLLGAGVRLWLEPLDNFFDHDDFSLFGGIDELFFLDINLVAARGASLVLF